MNDQPRLTQPQRVAVGSIYLALLWVLFEWLQSNTGATEARAALWFYSGALMIILGRYVVEPYFTRPADAIVNAMALLISLSSLPPADRTLLLGHDALKIYGLAILVLAVSTIALKDLHHPIIQFLAKLAFGLTQTLGRSQVIFSLLYLSAAWSFFALPGYLGLYVTALALWICITFLDVVGRLVEEISNTFRFVSRRQTNEIGRAIGCENPLLYNVEVDYAVYRGREAVPGQLLAIETKENIGSIGVVINRKQLLGKNWLSVYLLRSAAGPVMAMDLRQKTLVGADRSVFAGQHRAYPLDVTTDLLPEVRAELLTSPLYSRINTFVGYVTTESNINNIRFILLTHGTENQRVTEGAILSTQIGNEGTLYQVIDGHTKEERLSGHDSHGYSVGIARKLGHYDDTSHELVTRKWMPDIYTPLFLIRSDTVTEKREAEIARDAIGRLPGTDLEVRLKDLDAIVTHNTAILGILGIGKSCLAFELIKKVAETGVKIVCIDITNQYNTPEGLQKYIDPSKIDFDLADAVKGQLKATKDAKVSIVQDNPHASGNSKQYNDILTADLKAFMESPKTVKIYNPDWHPVSKGVSFKNTTLEDLSPAEKTRFIAERLFAHAMSQGESKKAKYLLVLEEAHSLVPEWNSVANDGDKNATNGTAKVILQGRKFGLGSMTITQRTANVSKSILNQCNTVFALRVFDDTGKAFLENYIGSDYANALPTLDERHTVAIGKGLRLRQPAIVQLNDRKHFAP